MIIKVIIDQIINIKLFRIMYIMLNRISKTVAHTTLIHRITEYPNEHNISMQKSDRYSTCV